MYAWADGPTTGRHDGNGARTTGLPSGRPAVMPAVVAYDIPRQRTWGWKVSSYIWTKSIAAGAALVPALMRTAGLDTSGPLFARLAPALALLFLAFTGALLVADLKRPERFWTILVRPQWRSWLARGAYVITAYGGLLAIWAWASWTGHPAWLDALAWPVALLSLATATYTAYLFAQCEGRDLWQSPLLLVELALHAPIAGLAILLVAIPRGTSDVAALVPPLGAALALTGLLALISAFGRHPTPNAAAAAQALVRGPQAPLFWASLAGGVLLPVLILASAAAHLFPLAGVLALAGLWTYGHALVLAGQGPPIS